MGIEDIGERLDGPPLIAFWGSDEPGSAFRLGTQEYDWHAHGRGQLFCIESGLVRVDTPDGSWLLPPQRAGWIPPGVMHKAGINGVLSGWGILLTPDASAGLPSTPCVLSVSEVLRALVRRAATWHWEEELSPQQRRLAAVLLDEVRAAPRESLHLPMPADRRALRIAEAVLREPASEETLHALALRVGVSERSARRLFNAETGMSFAHWRQQARLLLALEYLSAGKPIAEVADSLGYASASSFIAMFRKALGLSPRRYLSVRKT
ncbi:AraC family transcriptional regulator [Rhizobium sp. ERR 922]|uniref:AraC family transcriptional regulator n=1 Tax=unclassified Rhizobium TaxID=2613769 RepID=UPI0011A92C01|nr:MULTISPECIES: helix-turn-helix transcriptional regulator [unclassified Rhizobium]TWB57546.1 AraC family transcriptional regulator [Rhizobium sp. ERR 922]TWB99241.1 AraC family transcriptional regulator [Rhizobium sp. ERR 942]